ncbi:MAG: hypothetical protein R8M14_09450 [Ghiorsea sp.]
MKLISIIQKGVLHLAALAFVVGLVVAMPQTSSANTGANATILNVVTVNYKDALGVTAYAETATSAVTVNLVGALPTIATPANQTVASGGTATYVYTVTSNANGSDVYNIAAANTPTNATGSSSTPSVASITLGSSVITGVPAVNQVQVPAGTETNLAVNDIVVIGGVDYKISAIVSGTAASHANALPNDGVAGVTTNETPTLITLVANNTAAVPGVSVAGSNTAPALTVAAIAGLVAEQGTFTVAVTGTAGPTPGTGTVDTPITITPVTPPVAGPVIVTTPPVTTTFSGPNVTIAKDVSTDGGLTFAATGSGAPGDTLTYRITVTNGGAGNATVVVVTDPMPLYTTYTAGTAKSNTAATTYTDVANTVLTDTAADGPAEPYNFTGTTATLNIGTLAGASTTVLYYQVTID